MAAFPSNICIYVLYLHIEIYSAISSQQHIHTVMYAHIWIAEQKDSFHSWGIGFAFDSKFYMP